MFHDGDSQTARFYYLLAAIGFVAATVLLWAQTPIFAELDPSLLLRMAADCREGTCTRVALPTSASVIPLSQGSLEKLSYALLMDLGLGARGISLVMGLLNALAMLLVILAGARLGSRFAGFLSAMLFFGYLNAANEIGSLECYTFLPLPAALFYLCALEAAHTRRSVFYVASAFLAALLVQFHAVTLMLLPFLVLFWLRHPPRRTVWATTWALLVFAASLLPLSGEMLSGLRALPQAGGLSFPSGPRAFSTLVLFLVLLLPPAWLSISPALKDWRARPETRAVALLSFGPLLTFLLLAFVFRKHPAMKYLSTYLIGAGPVAFTVFFTEVKQHLARHAPRLAHPALGLIVAAGLLFLILVESSDIRGHNARSRAANHFTYDEIDGLVPRLRARGITSYREALCGVRSPQWFSLMNGLMVVFPDKITEPLECPDAVSLVVVKSRAPTPASLPKGWDAFASQEGWFVYLLPWRFAHDWQRVTFHLAGPGDGESAPFTTSPLLVMESYVAGMREYVLQNFLAGQKTGGRPADHVLRLELRVHFSLEPRQRLALFPLYASFPQGRIEHAEGLTLEESGALPVLSGGEEGGSGQVTVSWNLPAQRLLVAGFMPFVAEISEENQYLVQVLHDLR